MYGDQYEEFVCEYWGLKLTLRSAFFLHPKLLLDLCRLQYQLQVLLQWTAEPMQNTIKRNKKKHFSVMSILNNLNIVSTLKQPSKYSCGNEWTERMQETTGPKLFEG